MLIVKLLVGIIAGIVIGSYVGPDVIGIVVVLKNVLGQVISFAVPLVVLGFIAPAIASLKSNASKMLLTMLGLCYVSSVGAAAFAAVLGYTIVPHLVIPTNVASLTTLPDVIFNLSIPPVMPVMTALVLAIFVGISCIWAQAEMMDKLLAEINRMVLELVKRILIPLLPFFVSATFAQMAYTGQIATQLPVFLKVILIAIAAHFVWLAVLYAIGGAISRSNPWEVIRHYGPTYLTAVGTMSSAATLPVALDSIHKSSVISLEVADFAIPLGATTHLCGSVLTETFFCLTISQMLYGHMPSLVTMAVFVILFGFFAIGAPGVPGGTVMASLALVQAVLGFDDAGTALLLAIFALQDSFGTACNLLGDGALAMMLEGFYHPGKEKNHR